MAVLLPSCDRSVSGKIVFLSCFEAHAVIDRTTFFWQLKKFFLVTILLKEAERLSFFLSLILLIWSLVTLVRDVIYSCDRSLFSALIRFTFNPFIHSQTVKSASDRVVWYLVGGGGGRAKLKRTFMFSSHVEVFWERNILHTFSQDD